MILPGFIFLTWITGNPNPKPLPLALNVATITAVWSVPEDARQDEEWTRLMDQGAVTCIMCSMGRLAVTQPVEEVLSVIAENTSQDWGVIAGKMADAAREDS